MTVGGRRGTALLLALALLVALFQGLYIAMAPVAEQPVQVTTLAGAGSRGFAEGVGRQARFSYPYDLAVGSEGAVYVADFMNHRVRRVDARGRVTTLAGSERGFADGRGEGARFSGPAAVAITPSGDLLVADYFNHRIRSVRADGTVTTFAGSGAAVSRDSPALQAAFHGPRGLALARDGTLYVTDHLSNRLRRVTPQGMVETVMDGASPLALVEPAGVVVDERGTIYVGQEADTAIVRIDPAGRVERISTVVDATRFFAPRDLLVEPDGRILVADPRGNLLWHVGAGSPQPYAGSGTWKGLDGPLSQVSFANPWAVDVDRAGNVYVADRDTHSIRVIWRGTPPSAEMLALSAGTPGAESAPRAGAPEAQQRLAKALALHQPVLLEFTGDW